MRAVVAPDLTFADVPVPEPGSHEALVRTTATSLNRGEARAAVNGEPGTVWGWDVVGIVQRPAADGSGPPEGARVVGLRMRGAWAELAAVATDHLAVIPDGVTDAQAATLPVAGLTALRTLDRLGSLSGRRLLVTGASGGVGRFVLQLARRSGAAHVTAVARRQGGLRELGADEVLDAPPEDRSYDAVLESVGGPVLAGCLRSLKPSGRLVSYGASDESDLVIHPRDIYAVDLRYEGFFLFHELRDGSGTESFERMLGLVADGVDCQIAAEGSWTEIQPAVKQLIDRQVDGKYVLHVD
jgi:NADPH:quinone reductase-like Zn-dependent oxidoreductase